MGARSTGLILIASVLLIVFAPQFTPVAVFLTVFQIKKNSYPEYLFLLPLILGGVLIGYQLMAPQSPLNNESTKSVVLLHLTSGAILGFGFSKLMNIKKAILPDVFFIVLFVNFTMLVCIEILSGFKLGNETFDTLQKQLTQVSTNTKVTSNAKETQLLFSTYKYHIIYLFSAAYSIMVALMFYVIIKIIPQSKLEFFFSPGGFSRLKLPLPMMWVLLTLWGVILFVTNKKISLPPAVKAFHWGLLLIICFAYLMQGFGVITSQIQTLAAKSFVRILIWVFIFLLFILKWDIVVAGIFGIGIFDQWFNYRKHENIKPL